MLGVGGAVSDRPSRPSRCVARSGRGLPPLDGVGNEEVLGHDADVSNLALRLVVAHQQEVGARVGGEPRDLGGIGAVRDTRSEARLALALDLVLVGTVGTIEVRDRAVVGKLAEFGCAAVGAEQRAGDPALGPDARLLRAAVVGCLRFLEAEFHVSLSARTMAIGSLSRKGKFGRAAGRHRGCPPTMRNDRPQAWGSALRLEGRFAPPSP